MHDFHFRMNKTIKEQLLRIGPCRKDGNLSGSITSILKLLSPVMRREHQLGEQRESSYHLVKGEGEEQLADVHAYIPESCYRQLKMLHHDLNFFSIAQLVRFLIAIFLDLYQLYGDAVENELNGMFNQVREEERIQRIGKRKIVRQLYRFASVLLLKKRIFTIYDHNYAPFWIFRL